MPLEIQFSSFFPPTFQIVNFLLFVGLLVFFLRKPVQKHLINQHEQTQKEVQTSHQLLVEMEKQHKDLEKKILSLDQETSTLLAQAREDAEKEKEKILAQASRLAEKIIENAKRSAEHEAQETFKKLEGEVLGQAVRKAKELLQQKISETHHRALMKTFIQELKKHEPRA